MSADETAKTAVDPSMDDILASIRRILTEEEVSVVSDERTPSPQVQNEDTAEEVFSLDETMLVSPPATVTASWIDEPEMAAADSAMPPADYIAEPINAPAPPAPPAVPASNRAALIAPETAATVGVALGELVRGVQAERHAAIYRGGPTIEDVVRAEIRPVLKSWLDTHLPEMVERLVRSEIERLTGRVSS